MGSVDRFIQFNNETIDARELMHYENVAKALTKNTFLAINERKLMEFQPGEQTISLSVFWRHREEHVMRAGRMSDIFLMAEGFWKYFDVSNWQDFQEEKPNNLPKFMDQFVVLFRRISNDRNDSEKKSWYAKNISNSYKNLYGFS